MAKSQINAALAPEPEEAMVAEEYASVTITIDHLLLTDDTHGHTVVKNVWSTESAVESLLAQIEYFGHTALLRDPAMLDMIAQGNKQAAVFVYAVPERNLTNVIVDAAVWSELLEDESRSQGTVLGAHASLIALAADLKRSASQAGKDSRVLAYITD